jgi:predicted RecB family nuclease
MARIDQRTLGDLEGIGRAMLRDFDLLGVTSVEDLARRDAQELYERLSRITRSRQDPCVLDVFNCAIAQARDPELPAAERKHPD